MQRMVMIVLLSILLCLTGGYITLFKPYLTRESERTSDRPEELLVEYVAETCDPYAPRLFEVQAQTDPANVQLAAKGLALALPQDLKSPEDTDWAFAGNRFLITGYRYRQIIRNWVTRQKTVTPGLRIDVISWRSIVPAKTWAKAAAADSPHAETLSQAVEHHSQFASQPAALFQLRKYNDCF